MDFDAPHETPTAPLNPALVRIRTRLTLWFVATFTVILLALGGGLFVVIRHQYLQQLDRSLVDATTELIRAARIREMEADSASGNVVDAVDELRIPERALYLLDAEGNAVRPAIAETWIREVARAAAVTGRVEREVEVSGDRTLRLHAERFELASGTPMIAVAVADKVELQNRYASLIAAFGGAAAVALLLVATGTTLLVRTSMAPVERSLDQMRRFMADAAHELRTPLTIIRSRAEVTLRKAREPQAYAAALRGIEAESERLGDIVADLLTLSRVDAGDRTVERRRIFLDDLVADAAVSAQSVAEMRGVSLEIGEFEESPVLGDAELLRQLAVILLDNAIKFTPAGGRVRVRVAARGAKARIEIEDTGVGISSDQMPRIFDRFYRGDAARQPREGAGLGLSIAKWIGDAHGATIDVTSQVGAGTTFTVLFPEATADATL
ncbi:MAG: ATP-binding protein [Gemmatimonadaceae bacterium]